MQTVASTFDRMAEKFYPPAALGLNVVYQFDVVDGGNYFIAISDGACTIACGDHDAPSITLTLDSDTVACVVEGSLSSVQAFMFGKVRVKGDIALAKRLEALFSA